MMLSLLCANEELQASQSISSFSVSHTQHALTAL